MTQIVSMKNVLRIIFSLIFFLVVSCFGPIEKIRLENDADYVPLGDAKNQLMAQLLASTQNCPGFYDSGLDPMLSWGMMIAGLQQCSPLLGSDSASSYGNNGDLLYGCAREQFVKKSNLAVCSASFLLLREACQEHANDESYWSSTNSAHFQAYAICAGALGSDMVLPMMFF